MKYKVIKEYAGIEVGSIVNISQGAVNYMVSEGYVEQIIEPKKATLTSDEAQNIQVTIEGRKLSGVLNKAIEPKYKRNKLK